MSIRKYKSLATLEKVAVNPISLLDFVNGIIEVNLKDRKAIVYFKVAELDLSPILSIIGFKENSKVRMEDVVSGLQFGDIKLDNSNELLSRITYHKGAWSFLSEIDSKYKSSDLKVLFSMAAKVSNRLEE